MPAPPAQSIPGDAEDSWAVFLRPDIVYGHRDGRPLRLGLLGPLRPGQANDRGLARPLVVFVQGSGFAAQNLALNVPQLAELAHRGYAVATVEVRPAAEAPFPGHLLDLRMAIRHLAAHAAELGADPGRLALWGMSSGGYSVAMVGLTAAGPPLDASDPDPLPVPVRAVVDCFGPADLLALDRALAPDAPGRRTSGRARLLGGPATENPELARRASPLHQISPGRPAPPFLLIHGDADSVVPYEQSERMHAALSGAGHDSTLVRVRGADHSRRLWSPQLIATIDDFLRPRL